MNMISSAKTIAETLREIRENKHHELSFMVKEAREEWQKRSKCFEQKLLQVIAGKNSDEELSDDDLQVVFCAHLFLIAISLQKGWAEELEFASPNLEDAVVIWQMLEAKRAMEAIERGEMETITLEEAQTRWGLTD